MPWSPATVNSAGFKSKKKKRKRPLGRAFSLEKQSMAVIDTSIFQKQTVPLPEGGTVNYWSW